MPFPFCVPPGLLQGNPVLNETIWADADSLTTGWEDEVNATASLYAAVNSNSDTDFVRLITDVLNSTVTIRFRLQDPSADPNSNQNVELGCKFKYNQVFDPLDNAPTAVLRIKEGTSTIRAVSGNITVTTTATEQSEFMSVTEINNVTDWSDLYGEISFTTSGNGVDQDVNYELYRVRIIFS